MIQEGGWQHGDGGGDPSDQGSRQAFDFFFVQYIKVSFNRNGDQYVDYDEFSEFWELLHEGDDKVMKLSQVKIHI